MCLIISKLLLKLSMHYYPNCLHCSSILLLLDHSGLLVSGVGGCLVSTSNVHALQTLLHLGNLAVSVPVTNTTLVHGLIPSSSLAAFAFCASVLYFS